MTELEKNIIVTREIIRLNYIGSHRVKNHVCGTFIHIYITFITFITVSWYI